MIEAETVELFFRAVSASLAATAARRPRNHCEAEGRCVYDQICPFVRDCELSDYIE